MSNRAKEKSSGETFSMSLTNFKDNPIRNFPTTSNPVLKNGRRFQLLQIILPFIPLALILQTTFSLNDLSKQQANSTGTETQATLATGLGKVISQIQLERSEVAFFIFTNGSTLRSNLSSRFSETDKALENLLEFPDIIVPIITDDVYETYSNVKMNLTEFKRHLADFRSKIHSDENSTSSMTNVMRWYNSINAALLDHLSNKIKEIEDSDIRRHLMGFENILRSIESYGIASVHGINYFERGPLNSDVYVDFVRRDVLGEDLLNTTVNYVPSVKDDFKRITSMPGYESLHNSNGLILRNHQRISNIEEAISYFDLMANYLDELRKIQSHVREKIGNVVNKNASKFTYSIIIAVAILALALLLTPIIIYLVRNATNTIHVYESHLSEKVIELEREKHKSDMLLFQMLPPRIATQLMQTQKVSAEYFDEVTIYFNDIVGFTQFSAQCTPHEVVNFLNSLYKVYDEITENYDVYKVETIGDSYMVVSGLPEKNGNNHPSEIAAMALDFLEAVKYLRIPRKSQKKMDTLQIRCGAHTGPVVAGVVGTKMPRYCLFGDTVNQASRMESTGEAMKMQITADLNDKLISRGGFKTEPRGLVEIKGKGPINTYWLLSRESPIQKREEISLLDDVVPEFMRNLQINEFTRTNSQN